jgi:hypothetical protein
MYFESSAADECAAASACRFFSASCQSADQSTTTGAALHRGGIPFRAHRHNL